MAKYFGTDGFRGETGITLTADHAYKVGRFLYIKILVSEQGNATCEKLSNCHNLLIMRNDKKDY